MVNIDYPCNKGKVKVWKFTEWWYGMDNEEDDE